MIINVFNDIPEILRDFRAIHVYFSRNLVICKPLCEIFAKPHQILTKSAQFARFSRNLTKSSPNPHHISTICEIFAKPRKPFMKSYTSSKSILKFKILKLSQKILEINKKNFFMNYY